MAGIGPPPTPTALLKARGSWRAGERAGEPTPTVGAPRRPKDLRGAARKCWDVLVEQLEPMGVLTLADRSVLEQYCRAYVEWRRAHDFLDEQASQTYAIKDTSGRVVGVAPWPQVSIALNYATLLTRLGDRLGLNPSARTRIAVETKERTGAGVDVVARFFGKTPARVLPAGPPASAAGGA